jgi:hypothetical protein
MFSLRRFLWRGDKTRNQHDYGDHQNYGCKGDSIIDEWNCVQWCRSEDNIQRVGNVKTEDPIARMEGRYLHNAEKHE